ncbi:MAG: hypothetical protein AAFR71_00010 [Pseudomonadota bacterium]
MTQQGTMTKSLLASGALLFASQANAAQVFATDLIVQGSTCVGIDCTTSESFSFDTIRLKENNLRIKFDDTSASGSFPNNDWEITINESDNGGRNKFSITDVTGSRVPFTIEAGAPNNALYLEDDGDLGLGTNSPVVEFHVVDGDSPTMRLEQDGSSGFQSQVWDIAGNETNFFVRDVSNGSKLPFKIIPNAPTNALYVSASGNIGFREANPGEALHVNTGGSNATILLETTGSGGVTGRSWFLENNAGSGRFNIGLDGGNKPFKLDDDAVENLLRVGFPAADDVEVNGDLFVSGDVTISGQCTEVDGACADFVFQDDYVLPSLDDVQAFIQENRHLPDIPSEADMKRDGINLQNMSGRLLQKIEELTLYTIEQQDDIRDLKSKLKLIQDAG